MKITKIGHCCLVIEENGVKLMTDPGAYSTGQEKITGLDAVLITHDHPDHIHVESLQAIIKNNPKVKIFTNQTVGKKLDELGIKYEIVDDGNNTKVKEILIEGFGKEHAPMAKDWPLTENTGYFVAEKLFYPGDAFYIPPKKVKNLALPVAGPWMKISEAIDYAEAVKPEVCFPVHDGMFQEGRGSIAQKIPEMLLPKSGIKFIPMKAGDSIEI